MKLAVSEPGANWNDEGYGRSIKDAYVPGWELPADWASPDKDGEGGPEEVRALAAALRLIKRRAATRSGM